MSYILFTVSSSAFYHTRPAAGISNIFVSRNDCMKKVAYSRSPFINTAVSLNDINRSNTARRVRQLSPFLQTKSVRRERGISYLKLLHSVYSCLC
jgi:hypothetical protein